MLRQYALLTGDVFIEATPIVHAVRKVSPFSHAGTCDYCARVFIVMWWQRDDMTHVAMK